MGAGTYYTLDEKINNERIRACWIDMDDNGYDEDDHFNDYQSHDFLEHIKEVIKDNLKLSKTFEGETCYYGHLFAIELESKYYGDGIVINFRFIDDMGDDTIYNMQQLNYERCYNKIINTLKKFFKMRIATSGFTCELIN